MDDLLKGTGLFRRGYYEENRQLFASLAEGQNPRHLFIACSDSRLLPSRITDSAPGDLFIIRNIANMVPPWNRAQDFLSVSSAIEYAVVALEVEMIIVCGHSGCGGCKLLMNGSQESLPLASSWVKISSEIGQVDDPRVFEQHNVLHQIQRLLDYPFIAERHNEGRLFLRGWHYTIETGEIHQYNTKSGQFELIN